MDYQRCKHRFTILYPLVPKGVRGYFTYDIASTVNVGVEVSPIRGTVESTLDTLATKGGSHVLALRVVDR
jgi:hypothetical protein